MSFGNGFLGFAFDGSKLLPETRAYITRVLADGGTVINPVQVNKDFMWLKSNNLLSSLKWWLVPYAGIKKDGSNKVSKIYSYSGSSQDMTQGTGSAQPTFADNKQNGLPTLTFTTSNFMTATFTYNENMLSLFTTKQITWANGARIFNSTVTDDGITCFQTGSSPTIRQAVLTNNMQSAPSLNNMHLLTAQFQPTSGFSYIDGVQQASGASAVPNIQGVRINGLASGIALSNQEWAGWVAFNNIGLTTTANSYLKSLWGL